MDLNTTPKQPKLYTDKDYIDGLKNANHKITHAFFYSLCCFTLNDIRWSLMQGHVDYDELVNELFLYLSADNWHKLDTFKGKNNCSLKSWVVRLAWRFFMQQRTRLLVGYKGDDDWGGYEEGSDDVSEHMIRMDVESTFRRMPNKKYVQTLRWMLIDGYDADEVAIMLGTTVSNVYNIKHRAIVQFVETYNQ